MQLMEKKSACGLRAAAQQLAGTILQNTPQSKRMSDSPK
jgi:hypothetical protein